MNRSRVFLTTVLLAASVGCDLAVECTLIGCSSGLGIRFQTPATVPYRIEALSGFATSPIVYECKELFQCAAGAYLADYRPGSAEIRVIAGKDTTTAHVTPEYKKSQPNGERCGPTCFSATVELRFPGT